MLTPAGDGVMLSNPCPIPPRPIVPAGLTLTEATSNAGGAAAGWLNARLMLKRKRLTLTMVRGIGRISPVSLAAAQPPGIRGRKPLLFLDAGSCPILQRNPPNFARLGVALWKRQPFGFCVKCLILSRRLIRVVDDQDLSRRLARSEEHTSELQSLR